MVLLRTPAPGQSNGGEPLYRFGSGYVIGPERVLTAAHVLQSAERCAVSLPDAAAGGIEATWLDGDLVAADVDLDLAVIAVQGLAAGMPRMRWGELVGDQEVHWHAAGFPLATRDDEHGRQVEWAWGDLNPQTEAGTQRLGLTVRSRDAADTGTKASNWGGLSGAAIIVERRIVGVVTRDPKAWGSSLAGTRIAAAAEHADLWVALGRPQLEPVDDKALRELIAGLRRYGDELPYLAIQDAAGRGDRPIPELSDIYIEQQQEEATEADADAQPTEDAVATRETAREALARHRHVVIEGSPGLGKSTLMHRLAATALDDEGLLGVPVPVTARALAAERGDFTSTLFEAMRQELGKAVHGTLPDDLLQHPPVEGVDWLVLVDAFDEIIDGASRTRLAGVLADVAAGDGPYRFVITSRPVPELADLEPAPQPEAPGGAAQEASEADGEPTPQRFGHYRLRPFTEEQKQDFVRAWFRARSPHPDADTERFLAQVEESRLGDLTTTPLLLTMTALLFEERGGAGLPASRADLYRAFVAMLLDDEEAQRDTREAFVQRWQRQAGNRGEAAADRLFSERRDLVKRLAQAQLADTFAADAATRLLADEDRDLPDEVTHPWLRDRITDLLGRSGVVTLHAGRLTFVHDTFREYFVALAETEGVDPTSEPARALIGQWRYRDMREVVLFAIAMWAKGDATPLLQQIWRRDPGRRRNRSYLYPDPLEMVVTALVEGLPVTPAYEAQVLDALLTRLREDWMSYDGMQSLGRLRRVDELLLHARSLPDTHGYTRLQVAQLLTDLGEIEAAQSLIVEVSALMRQAPEIGLAGSAADLLLTHGSPDQARDLWRNLLANPLTTGEARITATRALAALDPSHDVTDDLRSVADDETALGSSRVLAARLLAGLEDLEQDNETWGTLALDDEDVVVETLADVATGSSPLDFSTRTSAATALVRLGRIDLVTPTIPALVAIVTGPLPPGYTKLEALQALVAAGAEAEVDIVAVASEAVAEGATGTDDVQVVDLVGRLHGAEGLVALAKAWTWGTNEAIQRLGERAALGELRTLFRDPGLSAEMRRQAAEALARAGELDSLLELASDDQLALEDRARVALALTHLERLDVSTTTLRAALEDRRTTEWERRGALREFAETGRFEPLQGLVDDATVGIDIRLDAAAVLAEHERPAPLLRLCCDRALPVLQRLDAAASAFDQSTRVEVLVAISRESHDLPADRRIDLATDITELAGTEADRELGLDLLHDVADDRSVATSDRVRAAAALIERGRTEVRSLLQQVAPDPHAPLDARRAAVDGLITLLAAEDVERAVTAARDPVLVRGKVRREFVGALESAADSSYASVTVRQFAQRALRTTNRRHVAKGVALGDLVLFALRVALIGGACFGLAGAVGDAATWLADHETWFVVPRPSWPAVVITGGVFALAILVWAYVEDGTAPTRPLRKVVLRAVLDWGFPPQRDLFARLLVWPFGMVLWWAATVLVASGIGAVGVMAGVAFWVPFLLLLVVGGVFALVLVIGDL